MAAIFDFTLWKIIPAFSKEAWELIFLQIPWATWNNRQTLLAEGWSRKQGFGPY